jgi:hypothetical protein
MCLIWGKHHDAAIHNRNLQTNLRGNTMKLYLATCEVKDPRFTDVLFDLTRVMTLRCAEFPNKQNPFCIRMDYTQSDLVTCAFKTESSMRAGLKKILEAMGQDVSFADKIIIKKEVDQKQAVKKEIEEKLNEVFG